MKIEDIKSSSGYTVAVRVLTPYKDMKEQDFIDLVREYGTVVWKKDTATVDEYIDFQMRVGYHQAAEIWCNDDKYPQIYRVTNLKVKDEHEAEGLFGHGELDWHCNILFTPDSEEMVGLRAVEVPKGSQTIMANSIPFWSNLSEEKRELYDTLYLSITNKMEDTYENRLAHYVLPTAELKDFDKKRASRAIQRSMNYDQAEDKFGEPRFEKKNTLKMISRHPLGIKGVYFPHLNLSYMCDKDGNKLDNHRELYDEIRTEYIDSDQYHYAHEWETGDICFMEQLTGVHRRNNVWEEKGLDPTTHKRELQRTSFWYKTPYRLHTDRCI
jgi:alpha-ketoglutarate-dependent taurine dioxygenase